VKGAMSGLLAPTYREEMLGNASILEVFNISKVGKVAGCRVTDGKVERGASVRLIRDNVVVHEGKLSTLKRFKDEVKEVLAGQECGMAFESYQDMRAGDVIECYRVEEVKRSLLAQLPFCLEPPVLTRGLRAALSARAGVEYVQIASKGRRALPAHAAGRRACPARHV